MPEGRPDPAAPPGGVGSGVGGVTTLAAPARRAERRIRLGRALDVWASAMCVALALAAGVLVLRKTGHASELARANRPRCLGRTDGARGSDRVPPPARRARGGRRARSLPRPVRPALERAVVRARSRRPSARRSWTSRSRTPCGSRRTVDPRRAVPLRLPRDAKAALVLALRDCRASALFEVRRARGPRRREDD